MQCRRPTCHVSSIVTNLKSETQLLVKLFEHNSFQARICQFMPIRSERIHYDNIEITIDNSNVSAVPLIKVLCVNIDEHLKFKEHASSISWKQEGKLMHRSGFTNTWVSKVVWRYINISYLSYFNYCPLVWIFVNKTDFDILFEGSGKRAQIFHNDLVSDKRLLPEQSNDNFIRLVTVDALHLKCLNVWMVWAQAILTLYVLNFSEGT